MCSRLLHRPWTAGRAAAQALHRRLAAATRPAAAPLVTGALADLARTKPDLLTENALLRQQLLILRRHAKGPRCTQADRALLVLLASRLRTWRQSLLIVQPETVLRWHRRLFRWHCAASPRRRPRRTARPSRPRRSR